MFDLDYLNRIDSSGLPSHNIVLKINSVIVLMRNLDITGRQFNDTKHIFLEVTRN